MGRASSFVGRAGTVAALCVLLSQPARASEPSWANVGSVATSKVDTLGQFTFEFDPGPIEIYHANGYRGWDHVVPLPAGTICEIRTFVGWDRGSIGEANLELNLGSRRLYERSEHKESPINYDAWKLRSVRMPVAEGTLLNMHSGAVQTGRNAHDRGLSTRVHFAVRFLMNTSGRCE